MAEAAALALPDTVTMTTTGLHIPAGITRDDWVEVGTSLGQIDRKLQWMVGDWINAGEREGYIDSDTYDAAERLFPQLSRKTLQEYAHVASKSSIRMEDVSFAHHQVVAALPPEEQAERLEEARDHNWPVSELREQMKTQPEPAVGEMRPRKRQHQEQLVTSVASRMEDIRMTVGEIDLATAKQALPEGKHDECLQQLRNARTAVTGLINALA
jgi:hypothetical protein